MKYNKLVGLQRCPALSEKRAGPTNELNIQTTEFWDMMKREGTPKEKLLIIGGGAVGNGSLHRSQKT